MNYLRTCGLGDIKMVDLAHGGPADEPQLVARDIVACYVTMDRQ